MIQVRVFGETALETLLKSGASSSGPPAEHRDVEKQTADALSLLHNLLPREPADYLSQKAYLPEDSLKFVASLVADLVHSRNYSDKAVWNRCVSTYMKPWFGDEKAAAFTETVRSDLHAVDKVRFHAFCTCVKFHSISFPRASTP